MHSGKAILRAKLDIDRVIRRAMRVANVALKNLSDEQVIAGMAAGGADAPAWTRLVTQVVSSKIKAEAQLPTPVQQTLNIVLVDRAKNVADWQQMVEEYKQNQPKLAAPIDVVPRPALTASAPASPSPAPSPKASSTPK